MKTCQPKSRGGLKFKVRGSNLSVLLSLLLSSAGNGAAAVRYVDASSVNPAPPYTNWASAARVIQDAVDAAAAGDEIVVTNGIYATGGRAVGTNSLVNRVAVDKPLTVRSVNGPEVTIIQGYRVPGSTNGDGAIRCVYLADDASLSGFTLTNGATRGDAGYWPDEAFGGGVCCESTNAVVSKCAISGNSASGWGGGAYRGTLNNCTLTGNSASWGGGASGATLNNCIIYFNTATQSGANYDTYNALNYCCTTPLPDRGSGNISLDPQLLDAAHVGADSPCRRAGSAAYATGTDIDGEAWGNPPSIGCDEHYAGVATGPLRVTLLARLTNVVVGYTVGLTALVEGHASLRVWEFGDGLALTNQPYTSHAWMVAGDYPVVLRAYNASNPGGVSATVTVHVVDQPVHYVAAGNVTPVPPYTSWATAATNIQDAIDVADAAPFPPGSVLVLVSNGLYATGGRAVVGLMTNRVAVDKPLVLRSVNGPEVTIIQGYQVPGTTNGDGAVRCVYLANGAALSGFTVTMGATRGSWNSALADDQRSGGGLWCESTTAVISNCVVVGNSSGREGGGVFGGTLILCTLATNSTIFGGGAFGSTLENCALTGNLGWEGGGAYLCTLNHCALIGNSAIGDIYGAGGGAAESTLDNCTLATNAATRSGGGVAHHCALNNCVLTGNLAGQGGGAANSTLNHCTLTGNRATGGDPLGVGGGVYGSALNNCIVYFNSAREGANCNQDPWASVLNYSCTTPMPTNGVGNITNAPLFVDYAGGNLRLQSNSPCINAGNNTYAPGPTDLDGNPRIVSATVDIGAYEFQGPGSVISYAWLQQYSLPTDGSVDAVDSDRDGHTTWQEWRCQTNPTNALSALRLLSALPDRTNVTVTWQSVAGANYFLERSTNLVSPFVPLATDIPGQAGATSCTDTNAAGLIPLFYRVGVGP